MYCSVLRGSKLACWLRLACLLFRGCKGVSSQFRRDKDCILFEKAKRIVLFASISFEDLPTPSEKIPSSHLMAAATYCSSYGDLHDDEPEVGRTPSSPSNSWSSAGTQLDAGVDSPHADGADGRRSKRCKISREQLMVLIKSFEDEPLPNFDQRQTLAQVLGMTPRSVQIWFQNRRQRLKPLQPKAASTATPLCGLQSAAMAARAAQQQGHRTAQQHLGMPGLAAAASSIGGYQFEQAMFSHLPAAAASYSMNHSLSSYGDIMEPFAATKALLSAGGAMGLSPEIRGRAGQIGCPSMALGGGGVSMLSHNASSSSLSNMAAAFGAPSRGSCPSPSTIAAPLPAPPKADKADGLLLLLACADGNSSTVE